MTKPRPQVLTGKTIKVKTECGSMFVTLNHNEGDLFEVRLNLGKSGNCLRALLEMLGICFSIMLQSGIPKEKLIKTLKKNYEGVTCSNPFTYEGKPNSSCMDVIARLIIKELSNEKKD